MRPKKHMILLCRFPVVAVSTCPHDVRYKIGIVHAAVSLESRGMLQLQPGERKVIKAAGEVDI